MSIQSFDANTRVVNMPPPNNRKVCYNTRANFMLSNDMLLKLHRLAAAKQYPVPLTPPGSQVLVFLAV